MKRILLTALISISTIGLLAQTGNLGDKPDECKKYLSLYTDNLSQKVYKDAYKFWVEAVKVCPEYNANLYDNGIYIMKKLKKGASKARENSLSDSIVWAYEQSIKLFGDNPGLNEDFGKDLILLGKIERGVEVMKKAIDSLGNKTKASSIMYYSNALAVLKDKEQMDCEVLVQEFERLSSINTANPGKGYDQSQEKVDKYLGPCLSCENLMPIVRKKFEEAKKKDDTRKVVLDLLKKRGCTDNDVYEALALIECQKNPNSDCYEALGNIEVGKKNYTKAIDYFDKAIELTEENSTKETLTVNVAKMLLIKGQSSKAGSYANSVLDLNANNGEAYLIKAAIIAGSRCGTSAFEDAAIYWAAYDMASKAKSVDLNVSSEASKAMSQYRARFPAGGDVFAQGLKTGESYKTCNGYSTTVK